MSTELGNSYTSGGLVFNPVLDIANLQAQSFSPLLIFTETLNFLAIVDFSLYQNRKLALSYIQELYNFPPPLFTESFDPTDYLVIPRTQTRFPSPGTFVDLADPLVYVPLLVVVRTLNYRDTDGPIDAVRIEYYTAVGTLIALLDTGLPYFDRIEFEATFLLSWTLYPIPFACQDNTLLKSPRPQLHASDSTTPPQSIGTHLPPFRRSSLRYRR
jgi:hypothetical protein